MKDFINCELHCHTRFSSCANLSFERIIKECERKDIKAIAITDHNVIESALEFAKVAPSWLRVIIGEEIDTEQGEVIGLFLKERIEPGKSLEYTFKQIKEQGGLTNVPHPFDTIRKKAINTDELVKHVDYLDMIEVFNSRNIFNFMNRRAIKFSSKHGLKAVCGSDAHTPYEIGKSILKIKPFTNASEFKDNLENIIILGSKSSPLVHLQSVLLKRKSKKKKS